VSDSDIYACQRCGAIDCKLWRPYSTFDIRLKCLDCACMTADPSAPIDASQYGADGSKPKPGLAESAELPYLFRRSWEIEWYIPAVPSASGSYWGYGAIPMDPMSPEHGDWLAWVALPLRMVEAS